MRPEKPNPCGVRENLDLVYQVNEQIRAIRWAMNTGDLKGVGRAIMALKPIIAPWFPKDKLAKYAAISYHPIDLKELHTEGDKADMVEYGELDKERIRILQKRQAAINKKRFFDVVDQRVNLIMETFKMLNLGFDTEDEAHISHDKKKQISSAKRLSKASTRVSIRKKRTA